MPVISNLIFTVTDTTIVATWTTDVSSDSNLTASGKAAIDNGVAANSTSHQCIVTGLSPNTSYSCIVTSGGSSSSPQNVITGPSVTRTPITSILFNPVKTVFANSGDTFYNFLSNDNNTYTTEDDGKGFAASPNSGSNNQICRFTNEQTLAGVNVNQLTGYGAIGASSGTDGPGGTSMNNKMCGLFGMAGSLYAFIVRQSYQILTQTDWFGSVIKSNDHGATWNNWQTPAVFSAIGIPPNTSTGPYFFGKNSFGWVSPVLYAADDGTLGYNTAGNGVDGANGFVYCTIMDEIYSDASVMYMCRIPRIQLAAQNASAVQFWTGPTSPTPADFVNDSNWSSTYTSATSIYSVTNQVSAPQVVFVPTFNRYLMLTWYRPNGSGSTAEAVTTLLEAPTPAGPWTLAGAYDNNPAGYYNPTVMHRSLLAVNSLTNANIDVITAGDYQNPVYWYFPSLYSITLNPTTATQTLRVVNFVKNDTSNATANTIKTDVFSSTTGNLLVVAVRGGTGNINLGTGQLESIKTKAGAPFTFVPGSYAGQSSAQATELFYLPNIVGNAAEQIAAFFNVGTSAIGLCCWEIAGADDLTPLDAVAIAIGSGSSKSLTSAGFSTHDANEIICAMGGMAVTFNSYSFTSTAGTPTLDSAAFPTGSGTIQFCGAAHIGVSSLQTSKTVTVTETGGATSLSSISVGTFRALKSYGISGNVGVAGASVAYSGTSSGTVTADGAGNYTIPSLFGGTYTVTPSKSGFNFSPANQSVIVSGTNQTLNFTGSLAIYSQPDCRTAKPSSATFETINGTKLYDVQTSSNPAIPPTDSRTSKPVASGTYPQNSRNPNAYNN